MPLTQANRPLRVETGLGADQLLIVDLRGVEAISRLFQFQLSLLADNATKVEFDKIIGQPVAVEVELPGGKKRHIHGICSRLAEGKRDATFTAYRMEVVPQFWLLTRRRQSRIFQQLTIPEVLKKVLDGLKVTYDLKGAYLPRDYLVQYRESDFDFASRLMEEEGIYYYFAHGPKGHELVVADAPTGHRDAPEFPKVAFDDSRGGNRPELRVTDWEKSQQLRSGKVTLWDHCFELPGQNLEAQQQIAESIAVGTVTHKLKLPGTEQLELYDYPGAFAQRFDGIDPGGGDRPGDLENIFKDNQRTAKLRIEQEAAAALEIRGASNAAHFIAGHRFTLDKHFSGNGAYVLTQVTHDARLSPDYRSGSGDSLQYVNNFTCIPAALPFRPPMSTPEPIISGPQTATVVGPPGEAIHCDKYGRVKVKFHWDRDGKADDGASCWVRVSQNWGGAKWGGMFIPHAGQEVIVEFEEGDPDRPLISGRVYNAAAMPPMDLPGGKSKSVIRDHGGNEIIMEGEAGREQIRMYSPYCETTFLVGAPHSPGNGFYLSTQAYMAIIVQKDWETIVYGKQDWVVAGNETMSVLGNSTETVAKRKTRMIGGHDVQVVQKNKVQRVNGVRIESTSKNRASIVSGNEVDYVRGNRTATVVGNLVEKTQGSRKETVTKDQLVEISGASGTKVTKDCTFEIGGDNKGEIKGGLEWTVTKLVDINTPDDIVLDAGKCLTLLCGQSTLKLQKDGTILLKGTKITIDASTKLHEKSPHIAQEGTSKIEAKGSLIDINGTGKCKVHGPMVEIN